MATETELYRTILTNLGVDCDSLPDNLTTTLLSAIAQNCGGGGSAGGGAFVVNWLLDDSGESYADKTFEEILEASKTMPVILVYTDSYDGSTQTYTLNNCAEGGFHAFFTRIMPSGISNGVYTGMRADYAQIAKGSNAITYSSVNL